MKMTQKNLNGMIEKMGYTECVNPLDANLIVFNTCCIRENAEDKLFRKTAESLKTIRQKLVQ